MDCFFLATLNTCHARKTIQIRGRDVKILQTLLRATSGKKKGMHSEDGYYKMSNYKRNWTPNLYNDFSDEDEIQFYVTW